jgi:hypothetical protein
MLMKVIIIVGAIVAAALALHFLAPADLAQTVRSLHG